MASLGPVRSRNQVGFTEPQAGSSSRAGPGSDEWVSTAVLIRQFVAEPYQRWGVARMLWNHAKADALKTEDEIDMLVRSSVYAVPVYERFGFTACGRRVDEPGVSYVPMRQVIRRSG